jgi:ATP-dependent DNA helicase RecG
MRRTSELDRPVQFLKGVGPRRGALLERLGLHTARDLLFHTPRRYEDASTLTRIVTLEPGMEATVVGRVVSKGVLPTRKGIRIFQAVVRDRSGFIECAWPGQPFLDRVIQQGDLLLISGAVRFFHGRQLHPKEFTVVAGPGEKVHVGEGVVFPVYPTTEGLPHRLLRQLVADNLDELLPAAAAEEVLPEELRSAAGVPRLEEALQLLHRPPSVAAVEEGRRRLALEELFFLQLIHARQHRTATRGSPGIAFEPLNTLVPRLLASLPFRLTEAQRRVLGEIGADMRSERRMNRLLQGDVGAGKTLVAVLAALRAIENGFQAALMVPTEILAEQHGRTIRAMLEPLEVGVEVLTGRMPAPARRLAQQRIASGEAQITVGTHALIQEGIRFQKLGLVIVDEQHRFGVRQRLTLSGLGENPDVLLMSATPIPRSLALTLYGDLDISILDQRPPGRRPIRTAVRRPNDRRGVMEFARQQVSMGRQAYIVYPLVEESESSALLALTAEFEVLREEVFPEFRLGIVHGQMRSEDKDQVMQAFRDGEIDILAATTVIEVGIDVPNATLMIVEHAERFGLSQLHQLRGRVGRGGEASFCILISDAGEAIERLRIFASTDDGFRIADADLRLRGQGDLFGARQSGLPSFRWASLERDLELLTVAREAARKTIQADPDLAKHPELLQALQRGFSDRAELFQTG